MFGIILKVKQCKNTPWGPTLQTGGKKTYVEVTETQDSDDSGDSVKKTNKQRN